MFILAAQTRERRIIIQRNKRNVRIAALDQKFQQLLLFFFLEERRIEFLTFVCLMTVTRVVCAESLLFFFPLVSFKCVTLGVSLTVSFLSSSRKSYFGIFFTILLYTCKNIPTSTERVTFHLITKKKRKAI